MRREFKLVIALILPQLAGLVGSVFTFPAIGSWYQNLNQPAFSPPNWIFGPVWTLLYLMMGLAWYLVWQKGFVSRLFLLQLAANSLWSILFFGMKNPGLAFGEVLILWGLIAALIMQFNRYSRLAAWLLGPYLAWVSFAAFLNYSIWQLN